MSALKIFNKVAFLKLSVKSEFSGCGTSLREQQHWVLPLTWPARVWAQRWEKQLPSSSGAVENNQECELLSVAVYLVQTQLLTYQLMLAAGLNPEEERETLAQADVQHGWSLSVLPWEVECRGEMEKCVFKVRPGARAFERRALRVKWKGQGFFPPCLWKGEF